MDEVGLILNLFKGTGQIRTLNPGEAIFSTGETGDSLYVVKTGSAQISVGDKVIEVVSDGDIVGEMSLIDGSARSADVVAVTPCQVVSVNMEGFLGLIEETPFFAIYIMRALTRRLRQMGALSASASAPAGPITPPELQPLVSVWNDLAQEVRDKVIEAAGEAGIGKGEDTVIFG
jgi:CRP/FNR family cyclic AMP-dependent transcriptional regulator